MPDKNQKVNEHLNTSEKRVNITTTINTPPPK